MLILYDLTHGDKQINIYVKEVEIDQQISSVEEMEVEWKKRLWSSCHFVCVTMRIMYENSSLDRIGWFD